MSFIVIDTETTGMGTEDQIVEIGAVWSEGQDCFLIKPTVPINVEARATHHITDQMLANMPTAPTWRPKIEKFLTTLGTPVFHNAEFDIRLIKQTWSELLVSPHICTYRVALHLWPDAPRHSNQVLRYWLGLEPRVKTNLPPHRALADTAITAALLEKMLETVDLDRMIELTIMPVVLHRVRFGKHIDQLWSEVPKSYLQWILRDGNFDRDIVHTAQHYLG